VCALSEEIALSAEISALLSKQKSLVAQIAELSDLSGGALGVRARDDPVSASAAAARGEGIDAASLKLLLRN